jgi:signal peptidase II
VASESEPIVAPERVRPRIGAIVLVLGLAVGILAVDQFAKWLVVTNLTEGTSVPILGELLQFEFVRNPGAAFSLGIGATWIFAVIAVAVAIFIVIFARRIRSLAWATVFGMLLGGTLGNLLDRLLREPGFGQGYVIDFIRIWGFNAIFNVADMAITFSVVLLLILTFMGLGLDGQRGKDRAVADGPAPEPAELGAAESAAAEPDIARSDAKNGDA